MPEPDSDESGDVDFVVVPGTVSPPAADPPEELPGHRWHRGDMRLRLTLAGGAVVLALITLFARATGNDHATPSPSASPPRTTSTQENSPQPILNPFQLATRTASSGNCPFATTCSSAPTSTKALAAVRAVFPGSEVLTKYTWLGVYNGHFGPNLLSRTITARSSAGMLTLSVRKPTTGDREQVVRRGDPAVAVVTVITSNGGYTVFAELAQHSGRADPTSQLARLAADPRLLAVR